MATLLVIWGEGGRDGGREGIARCFKGKCCMEFLIDEVRFLVASCVSSLGTSLYHALYQIGKRLPCQILYGIG